MEIIYQEVSGSSFGRKIFAGIALLLILSLFAYEYKGYAASGNLNYVGWGMNVCILALWVWRVCFSYTIILYKDQTLEVISRGLGIKRSYKVDLTRTESYTNKYVRSFFRRTKISHYIHRYCSLDDNPQRLLVFTEGKKNRLAGLIFKGSDKFMQHLRRQMPDKYIEL